MDEAWLRGRPHEAGRCRLHGSGRPRIASRSPRTWARSSHHRHRGPGNSSCRHGGAGHLLRQAGEAIETIDQPLQWLCSLYNGRRRSRRLSSIHKYSLIWVSCPRRIIGPRIVCRHGLFEDRAATSRRRWDDLVGPDAERPGLRRPARAAGRVPGQRASSTPTSFAHFDHLFLGLVKLAGDRQPKVAGHSAPTWPCSTAPGTKPAGSRSREDKDRSGFQRAAATRSRPRRTRLALKKFNPLRVSPAEFGPASCSSALEHCRPGTQPRLRQAR